MNDSASLTYHENKRPRWYHPDFIVAVRESKNQEVYYLAEAKGEMRHSTKLKKAAVELWCDKMSGPPYGTWKYKLLPQAKFEKVLAESVKGFEELVLNL